MDEGKKVAQMNGNEGDPGAAGSGDPPDKAPHTSTPALPPRIARTPMYWASNVDRYQRQELIKSIEAETKCKLICYVSHQALIDTDDTLGFVDLLHQAPKGGNVDLLLHTPGGDIDAAEKLIHLVRETVGTGRLRVIVPDFAKSAGTLMALEADEIVMSHSSALGPIDPQIRLPDGQGNMIWHSVQDYLDAYKTHSDTLSTDPGNLPARLMFDKLHPTIVKVCEAARNRAKQFAETHLVQGMWRGKSVNFTKIAEALMDRTRWYSHAQMITGPQADMLGLRVNMLDPGEAHWDSYWRLYCLQRLAVRDHSKLFESNYVSLPMGGSR